VAAIAFRLAYIPPKTARKKLATSPLPFLEQHPVAIYLPLHDFSYTEGCTACVGDRADYLNRVASTPFTKFFLLNKRSILPHWQEFTGANFWEGVLDRGFG
jgi:hypothetical protein